VARGGTTMTRFFRLVVGLLILSANAWADGAIDANRGINAAAHNKYEDAIALYTSALEGSGFSARDQASLYDKRGVAYASMGEAEKAIADFDRALRLAPDHVFAHFNRGVALDSMGRYDDAIADFAAAIAYDPQSGAGYFYRGQANFHARHFAAAASDFERDLSLAPNHALAIAWLYLANARRGRDAAAPLAQNAARIDLARWPGPVIALYLGKLTAKQVMAAAINGDLGVQADRQCQAYFYSGEAALLRHGAAAAKRFFQQATQHCPLTLTESAGARAELMRLER
jgi:lipoprotein NlpI